MKFITESIEKARKNKKKLIILTHHSPTARNTLEANERGSVIEQINYTNLEHLFVNDDTIALWACNN